MASRLLLAVLAAALLAACASSPAAELPSRSVVVDVPLTDRPELARSFVQGAQLAAEELDAAGGIPLADGSAVRLEIEAVDSGLSPTTTQANVRAAVEDGAVAVIDEGSGVDAAWRDAAAVGLPIGIVYLGGRDLVDASARPNVFRIAPTDRGVAFRLAEHVLPKLQADDGRIAVLTDDTAYGAAGQAALEPALARNRAQVSEELVVPAGSDPAPQVLRAREQGATALLVWASPGTLAEIVRAARGAGWDAPIYASLSAEDPLVRQRLADHPEWLDGMVFAMSRLTAERGPLPFETFLRAYEGRFGADPVGVTSGGEDVVQLPDFAMYSYDFVRLLAAAIEEAGVAEPGDALLAAMERVEISGANGDERSFNENSHEGVIDDDVFFAEFHDMVWAPVDDDPLSATLPELPQTR